MAVLTKGPAAETKVLDLTVGGGNEPIKSPCVKNYVQNRANWACSAHLYWEADDTRRAAEARKLAARTAEWESAGLLGVLGGDGRPDPAGRDAAGDLWLYRGDGKGGYAPRQQIGNGYPAGEPMF